MGYDQYTPGTYRHVWQLPDSDVLIYLVTDGIVADDPLITYCYLEGAVVRGRLPIKRIPATGRPAMKIITSAYEYMMDVDAMYFRKTTELDLTNIFNREQQLQIVWQFDDPAYTGTAPEENDPHTLQLAYATKFELKGQKDGVVQYSASFEGEGFI